MPTHVILVDLFGLVLALIGFNMAFRQTSVRRMLGRPLPPRKQDSDNDDPLTYGLRISGVMIMIFGVVIGGMVTLVSLS